MKYIALPDKAVRRLSFYLAMEEYIAHNRPGEDCFFMWQVNPTVIFGRNQLMENEINFDYVRSHGIEYYRRKSGGGCVYADFSNIMFSYITDDFNVSFTFDRYLQLIAHTLNKLGVKAIASGRNDITVDGKKVSGNAFYRTSGRSIVHGTMLFDTNLEDLVLSITPNNEKLITKGIESVRKRVTNLKEYLDIDIEEFKRFIRSSLCDHEECLTQKDIVHIEKIETEYLRDEWILGNNPRLHMDTERLRPCRRNRNTIGNQKRNHQIDEFSRRLFSRRRNRRIFEQISKRSFHTSVCQPHSR